MMRHDSTYPGLPMALDVGRVCQLLSDALPELHNGSELRGCTILDVRYRPRGACWILYRLKIYDESGRSSRPLLSARLLRPGEQPESPPRALLERYKARAKKTLRTPALHLPQVPMALYAFPLDTSLPGLFDAVDAETMKQHLGRMWAERKVRVRSVKVQPMGYTPHARAALLYDVLAEDRRSGLPELRRLIGKMHAKKKAARLFADSWAAWRAGGQKAGLVPPVGYIAAAGLTLQEQVRGQRLGGLVTAPGFPKWLRRSARLLANLHGLSLPLTTRRKPADEIQGVHRWAGVLMAIRPDLGERVERLRDRLAAEIETRIRLSAPIHADFHHTNILVDNDQVTIIDLDEMAFGDPLVDVGRFLASLRVPARRAFGDIKALQPAGESFLETYLKHAGGDAKKARLFEAASLLIAAGSSFRIQRANWEEEVALLIEDAENTLARACGSARQPENRPGSAEEATTAGSRDQLTAMRPSDRPNLSAEEQRRWASDEVYMQAALDPHVLAAYGAHVTQCRIRSGEGKKSDRSLSYNLRGWRGAQPWSVSLKAVRCERGGRSLTERLEELRDALKDEAHAPQLPRPIAYLKPLSLLVWETPTGEPFSSLLDNGGAHDAAEPVARALAVLHQTRLEAERERTVEHELRRLEKKLPTLDQARIDLAATGRWLFADIERRYQSVPRRRGPTVGTVHPHHVLCAGDRAAFDKIEEITLAHPFVDIADFLARVTLQGIRRDRLAEALEVAGRFRAAYGEASATNPAELAPFEAAALLRLACHQAERQPQTDTTKLLVKEAFSRLAS